METIMYLVGYDSTFKKQIKCGWGCGYVLVPIEHPIVKVWEEEKGEESFYYPHLDCGEEITLYQSSTIDGKEYKLIGFDSAHYHNSPDDNFDVILSSTKKMKECVDNFKG